ncbi:MAG: hypothetical protein GXP31_05215 [Kiritimatiellaeota bacterium]|nr:hypothetical protein [Kiritimatiellota bacterium]
MKRQAFLLLSVVLACSSCRTLDALASRRAAVSDAAPLADATAQQALNRARRLVREKKADAAQEALGPLLGDLRYQKELTPLLLQISKLRETAAPVAKSIPPAPEQPTANIDAGAQPPKAAEKALDEAARRLAKAETLAGRGELAKAEEMLAPLLGKGILTDRVEKLRRQIEQRALQENFARAAERSHARALNEVRQRLILPDNYGRTVTISRDLGPVEMPQGPMEDLVNRKVSMTLTNAGVKDMVMALSKVEGLNIIADEALEEDKKLNISVKDVPLKELLSYIARNMGIAFYVGENTIWVTKSDDAGGGPKLETRIYQIRSGFIPALSKSKGGGRSGGGGGGDKGPSNPEDTELEDAIEGLLNANPPDGAMYQIFKSRNLLLVRNTRESLRTLEELLRAFDQPPLQVLIEARFLTIGEGDLAEIGLDIPEFSLDGRDLGDKAMIMTMDGVTKFKDFKNATNGANITLSGILGNHTYRAVLHALNEKSSTRTLSAPRITVVNNHTARIRKGDTMYYFEEYDLQSIQTTVQNGTAGTVTQLVPSGSPTELELGITFTVKPSIGNDGKTIQLALEPDITQFIEWLNFQTSGDSGGTNNTNTNTANSNNTTEQPGGLVSLPKINESKLQTTVVVNSGDTVVLGGTLESKHSKTVRKVPILGDIPYLGVLFRHTEEQTEPQHLLIFVTATVIGTSGDLMDYRTPATGK